MLFIKAFTSYFHIYRPPTPPTVPSPHRPSSSSYCPIGAIHRHRRKNRRRAVVQTSSHRFASPRDALRHTQRAEPPFPGSPALRLNQLLFFLQHNFLCLAVDNNHIDTLVKANLAHAAECQLSGYGVDCKRLVALNADYAVGCNNLSCICLNLCYC